MMKLELIALALSILRYERNRRNRVVVIPGRWVDTKPAPPPIVNMADDRPIWLRRDRSKE